MKTTICFIRHGRTEANIKMVIQGRIDNPLSDLGKSDALNVANFIKEKQFKFDIILASPLSRALSTARIVKETIKASSAIITNDLLVEREFGEAESLPICPENYRRILINDFKGMETDLEICERSKQALTQILVKYPGKTILVVAHSHFIKSLFMQYDANVSFDTTFGHRSISLLEYEDGKLSSYKFNITN